VAELPEQLVGRRVEVRETLDKSAFYDGRRRVAEHEKILDPNRSVVTLAAHRPRSWRGHAKGIVP
jgi:hypothetical protein